jgi:hypothetical protein
LEEAVGVYLALDLLSVQGPNSELVDGTWEKIKQFRYIEQPRGPETPQQDIHLTSEDS